MNIIFTIIIFFAMLAVLIFVHEFGHFIAAKRSGVRVDEFGFGFPPRVWGKKIGETIYSINLLPFGGFVKVFGEDEGLSSLPDQPGTAGDNSYSARSFTEKPFYIKMFILFAGVIMNFFLAFVIFSFIQVIGVPTGIDDSVDSSDAKVFISGVVKDSPAAIAGLKPNDLIKEIQFDGSVVQPKKLKDAQEAIRNNAGENMTIVVLRGRENIEFNVVPRVDPPPGEGALGVELLRATTLRYPWYEAPWRGFWVTVATTITMIDGIIYLFSQMFVTGQLSSEIAGPVGIASLTGQMTALGISHLLHFVAIISLNLAILNALPFPALDGGRAFTLLLEKIRRKSFSTRSIQTVNGLGFAVLIVFLVFVTIHDIQKLI